MTADRSIDEGAAVVSHATLIARQVEALDAKRASLAERLRDSVRSEASALKRAGGGPAELCALVDWWAAEGKRIKVTGLGTAIRDGYGVPMPTWQKWKRALADGWEPHRHQLTGRFDTTLFVPADGFVVYGLYGHDDTLLYIGRTEHPRGRLRAHLREKGPALLARWELRVCATRAEMLDLEAILIDQHRPPLNRKPERRNGAAS